MKTILALMLGCALSFADLSELSTAEELETLVAMPELQETPIVVQFSAYWCSPCHSLKSKMMTMASEFEGKAVVAYVDAYVNSSLRSYLKGGYPTVRVFLGGEALDDYYFVGDRSESYVRSFIDLVVPEGEEDENP